MTAIESKGGTYVYLTKSEYGKLVNHDGVVYDKYNNRIRGASLDDSNYTKVSRQNQFWCKDFPQGRFELLETDGIWWELEKI